MLTQLLVAVCDALRSDYRLGVAFVERGNEKSLAVHRHYPMTESTQFVFKERTFSVFTFTPEQVLAHYR